mgnify:CR=1 FL=1
MPVYDKSLAHTECQQKIDANYDNGKKKKPQDFDATDLTKIKDIDHVVKKKIPHGKNSKEVQKIMALAVPVMHGDKVAGCINVVMLRSAMSLSQACEKYLAPLREAARKVEDYLAGAGTSSLR